MSKPIISIWLHCKDSEACKTTNKEIDRLELETTIISIINLFDETCFLRVVNVNTSRKLGFCTFKWVKLWCDVFPVNDIQRQSCSCICLQDKCETVFEIDVYLRILEYYFGAPTQLTHTLNFQTVVSTQRLHQYTWFCERSLDYTVQVVANLFYATAQEAHGERVPLRLPWLLLYLLFRMYYCP